MTDLPPWREITADDFHIRKLPQDRVSEAWLMQANRAHQLIQGQIAGEYRIRFLLREAIDMLATPTADPTDLRFYDLGMGDLFHRADEAVIVLRDGRRVVSKDDVPSTMEI